MERHRWIVVGCVLLSLGVGLQVFDGRDPTGRAPGTSVSVSSQVDLSADWSDAFSATIELTGPSCTLEMALEAIDLGTPVNSCPAGASDGTRILIDHTRLGAEADSALRLDRDHLIFDKGNLIIESRSQVAVVQVGDRGQLGHAGGELRIRNLRFSRDGPNATLRNVHPLLSNLTGMQLINVGITNQNRGSVVVAAGGQVLFDNVSFRRNLARASPLAIGPGQTIIRRSVFGLNEGLEEDTELGRTAGALLVTGFGGRPTEVRLEDVEFSGNRSSKMGGAILGEGAATRIECRECYFNGNQAGTVDSAETLPPSGGAIFVEDGAELTVEASSFVGNGAQVGGSIAGTEATIIVRDTEFRSGTGALAGGAIAAGINSRLSVERCLFQGGHSQMGGALALGFGFVATVDQSTFVANEAQTAAGAIALVAGNPDDLLPGGAPPSFLPNDTTTAGTVGSMRISGSVFHDNHAVTNSHLGEALGIHGDIDLQMDHVTIVNRPGAVGAAIAALNTRSARIVNSIIVSPDAAVCPDQSIVDALIQTTGASLFPPTLSNNLIVGALGACTDDGTNRLVTDAELSTFGPARGQPLGLFRVQAGSPADGLSTCLDAAGNSVAADHGGYPRGTPCTAGAFQIAAELLSRSVVVDCSGVQTQIAVFGEDLNRDGVLADSEIQRTDTPNCDFVLERDRAQGLEDERDELASATDALERERDGLESERDDLQNERDGLESERDDLQNERDGLESERDDLQNERDGLESERDTLAGSVQDLQGQLLDNQRLIAELRARAAAAEARVAELEDALADARAAGDARAAQLDEALTAARNELERILAEKAALEARLADREAALRAADETLQGLRAALAAALAASDVATTTDAIEEAPAAPEFDGITLRIGELTRECVARSGRVRGIDDSAGVPEAVTLDCQVLPGEPRTLQTAEGCACQ